MFKLLALAILLPCAAFSQTIPIKPTSARLDGNTVCLTLPVAAKVRDSLTVLPLVRKEAYQWRKAASRYQLAADTARAAYLRQAQATANVQVALREETIDAARYQVSAKSWKAKARRRSFWNWLAAAAVGGLTLGFVTR